MFSLYLSLINMKASDKKLKNNNWKVKIIKANETSDAIS
jgi:hypothetical protein